MLIIVIKLRPAKNIAWQTVVLANEERGEEWFTPLFSIL